MAKSLAEVLRRFAPAYRQRYPQALLPSHERAIRDIIACRTVELGGHLWHCPNCDKDVYVYHGCRNRACPSCHGHTWTGMLTYHPHVHCLVTAGGVSADGKRWKSTRPGFFLSVRVLSRHLRQLFQSALQRKHPELFADLPPEIWKQEWVLHCIPWGNGQQGVLSYLARYVFRIAITDRRILAINDQRVSFAYKDRKGNCQRTCTLQGVEFIRRFCQHILPQGFHKVRYYGLWNPKRREQAQQVRVMLQLQQPAPTTPTEEDASPQPLPPACPHCGCRELQHLREIPRPRNRSP